MFVILPYFPGDEAAARRLADWIGELGGCKGHELLLVADNRSPDLTANFRPHFDKIYLTWVTDDAWNTWPDSANNMFRKGAKYVEFILPVVKYFLWMEPDAVPLVPNWADILEAEFKEGVKLGKRFMGDRVQVENVPLHMSGIGVYPSPLSNFAGPAYLAQEIAWDCYAANEIVPKAHFTKLIEHAWRHPTFEKIEELETQIRHEAVLFHASKDGSLIELLRKKKRGETFEEKEIQEKGQGDGVLTNVLTVHGTQGEPVAEPKKVQETHGQPTTGGPDHPVRAVTTDIFIKTYPQDYEWLKYCLRSIKRFASGFRDVHIITPDKGDLLQSLDYARTPVIVQKDEYCEDGYLSQQIFKVYADEYTNADYILHIDSDTMFTTPVTPQTFLYAQNAFYAPRPIWMITPRSQVEPDNPWIPVMREFMSEEPEFEFMRRFPFVLPRWFYKEFRTFIQGRHHLNADEYIKSRPFKSFSEFNCMGFFAYKFYRDRFHWVDTSKDEWPPLTVEQLWSHGGLTDEIRMRRELIFSEVNPGREIDLGGAQNVANGSQPEAGVAAETSPLSVDPTAQTFPDLEPGVWPKGMGTIVPFPKEVRFHAESLAALASSAYRRQKVRDSLKKVGLIR